MKRWPLEDALELIRMEPNERDAAGLLAALLDAEPVDEDGWPKQQEGR